MKNTKELTEKLYEVLPDAIKSVHGASKKYFSNRNTVEVVTYLPTRALKLEMENMLQLINSATVLEEQMLDAISSNIDEFMTNHMPNEMWAMQGQIEKVRFIRRELHETYEFYDEATCCREGRHYMGDINLESRFCNQVSLTVEYVRMFKEKLTELHNETVGLRSLTNYLLYNFSDEEILATVRDMRSKAIEISKAMNAVRGFAAFNLNNIIALRHDDDLKEVRRLYGHLKTTKSRIEKNVEHLMDIVEKRREIEAKMAFSMSLEETKEIFKLYSI